MREEGEMNKKSLVAMALRLLTAAKYGIAGALGATAVLDTISIATGSVLSTPTAANIASVTGALLMTIAAKVVHLI
jgi:hypothetical protein